MAIRALLLVLAVLANAPKASSADANDLMRVLQSGRCTKCRLADADLVHADLRDADLQGAELQRANLGQARLDGADLKGADLSFTSLKGASLRGADLFCQQQINRRSVTKANTLRTFKRRFKLT